MNRRLSMTTKSTPSHQIDLFRPSAVLPAKIPPKHPLPDRERGGSLRPTPSFEVCAERGRRWAEAIRPIVTAHVGIGRGECRAAGRDCEMFPPRRQSCAPTLVWREPRRGFRRVRKRPATAEFRRNGGSPPSIGWSHCSPSEISAPFLNFAVGLVNPSLSERLHIMRSAHFISGFWKHHADIFRTSDHVGAAD